VGNGAVPQYKKMFAMLYQKIRDGRNESWMARGLVKGYVGISRVGSWAEGVVSSWGWMNIGIVGDNGRVYMYGKG
jgi:hypothetical protein